MTKIYSLYIDAYSPETMPMARLAEYMQSFAQMLGHEAGVHFAGLKPGSTRLAGRVRIGKATGLQVYTTAELDLPPDDPQQSLTFE